MTVRLHTSGLIGIPTSVSHRPHRIHLENPGPRVPDPDGGYTLTWVPCSPADVFARIRPASTQDLDQVTAGTELSVVTHIVTIPYQADVSTATRITFNGRTLAVIGPPTNAEERNIELDLVCAELAPTNTGGSVKAFSTSGFSPSAFAA